MLGRAGPPPFTTTNRSLEARAAKYVPLELIPANKTACSHRASASPVSNQRLTQLHPQKVAGTLAETEIIQYMRMANATCGADQCMAVQDRENREWETEQGRPSRGDIGCLPKWDAINPIGPLEYHLARHQYFSNLTQGATWKCPDPPPPRLRPL